MKRLSDIDWRRPAAVFMMLAIFGCRSETGPAALAVKRGDVTQRVTVSGTIAPNRKTIIAPPYSGYVKKIYVRVGDKVRAGAPVISVAQSLSHSADGLYPLLSPFDGVVVQVMTSEGEYVDPASTGKDKGATGLVRIDDLSQLLVDADIPELEIPKLRVGQAATLRSIATRTASYKGEILSIALAAKDTGSNDRLRVQFAARLKILNPDRNLNPGMSVIVDVATQKVTNVLVLQHDYVGHDREGEFVLSADNRKIRITTGLQDEDLVEVKSGVSDGQLLLPIEQKSIE